MGQQQSSDTATYGDEICFKLLAEVDQLEAEWKERNAATVLSLQGYHEAVTVLLSRTTTTTITTCNDNCCVS